MQTINSFLKVITKENQTRYSVHRLWNENSKTGPMEVLWNIPWVCKCCSWGNESQPGLGAGEGPNVVDTSQ